MALLALQNQAT